MLGNGDYGIYPQQLARDIAHHFRRTQQAGMPRGAIGLLSYLPFKSMTDGVRQGHLIEFTTLDPDFEARTTDEEIAYFKNFAMQKARHPDSDTNLTNLRRNTWGVSISDVDEGDCGIAVVNGPACVECVLGTATATNVGNFIVPWTTKDKAGKAEIRPYGIAQCTEQTPGRVGWRWVLMGQPKWDFIGKTSATHNKGSTVNVNVHFGSTKGSETATGITQSCYNRFADLASGLWVRGSAEYLGWELTVGECA